MIKEQILTLPVASTSAIYGPMLIDQERGLFLSMVCDDDGLERPFSVVFNNPRAFRKRGEVYCTSWHVKDVYDIVCEIQGSDWVDELKKTLFQSGGIAG